MPIITKFDFDTFTYMLQQYELKHYRKPEYLNISVIDAEILVRDIIPAEKQRDMDMNSQIMVAGVRLLRSVDVRDGEPFFSA